MPHIGGTLALERPQIILAVATTTDCWNVSRFANLSQRRRYVYCRAKVGLMIEAERS